MSVSFFFLFKESFLANTISFRYMLLHSKHEECCGFYNFKTTPFFKNTTKINYVGFWNNTLRQNLHHSVFFWCSGFDCFPKAKIFSGRVASFYTVWFILNAINFPAWRSLSVQSSLCSLLLQIADGIATWVSLNLWLSLQEALFWSTSCKLKYFSECIWIWTWFRKSSI